MAIQGPKRWQARVCRVLGIAEGLLQRVAGWGLQAEQSLEPLPGYNLQGYADVSTSTACSFLLLQVIAGLLLASVTIIVQKRPIMQQGQGQGQASKDMHRQERACSAYCSHLLPLKAGAWWTSKRLPCLEAPACNTLQQPLCSACQNPASLSWPPDMLTMQQELSVNLCKLTHSNGMCPVQMGTSGRMFVLMHVQWT